MLRTILFLIIIFLSLLGLSEIIFYLGGLLFRPKVKPRKYLKVYLDASVAESQILSELFNLRWFGDRLANKIVFITENLDAEDAKRFEKEYKSDITEFKNEVFNERAR